MRHLKANIAYDGTKYLGWQQTKEGSSIEESLQKVLETIFQHPIALEAASRTDAGVHAKNQVVKFSIEKDTVDLQKLLVSLNQLLPNDIAVKDLSFTHQNFHPTLDARSKTYEYLVTTGPFLCPFKRLFYWHISRTLDLNSMLEASKHLIGYHDFKSFTNDRDPPYENTHRTIYDITISEKEMDLHFLIKGHHFLYKMVRNLIGTLIYVGLGKIKPDAIPLILEMRSRPASGVTAPANGLTLLTVEYNPMKNFSFIPSLSILDKEMGSL